MGIIDSISKLCVKIYNTLQMKKWGGRLFLGKNVKFHQKISLYGDGCISLADGCEFGYKIGGGYYKGRCELQARSKEANVIIGSKVLTNNNLFVYFSQALLGRLLRKCLCARRYRRY